MQKTEPVANGRRRREFVQAAFSLIAEKGFEGLRTRDIANRVGANISTLHYHFGTKERLLDAVVDHVRDTFTDSRPRSGHLARSAKARLRSHFADAWRAFESNPDLAVVLQELTLRANRDPATRAALHRVHDYWSGLVEEILRKGVAEGELRADLDPRAGAAVVTSFIIGARIRLGVNPKAFDFQKVWKEVVRWLSNPKHRL